MVDYLVICPDFGRVYDIGKKLTEHVSAHPGNCLRGKRGDGYVEYEIRFWESNEWADAGKWITVRIATRHANNQGLRASIYTADEAEAILDKEDISR